MTPEINELKNAYERALVLYLDAVSDSNTALREAIRLGAIQDADAYVAVKQIEGKRHAEYLAFANRLSLALTRKQ